MVQAIARGRPVTGPRAFGDRATGGATRAPRARAATPAQTAALVALSRVGALLVKTMTHGVVVARNRRTLVATGTVYALIRHGWTEITRPILHTRTTYRITDAGRLELAAAKRRARG